MAYYDALVAKWADLSGTTVEKLAAINSETVAGPRRDVSVSTVVGHLMLSGAYLNIAGFAQGAFNGDLTHDEALSSAKMLIAQITSPNAPSFNMSDPGNYAAISRMLATMVSYSGSGMTNSVRADLLSLCETTLPWWQVNGYTSIFSDNDLVAAGGLR